MLDRCPGFWILEPQYKSALNGSAFLLEQLKVSSAPTDHSCPQFRHERGLLRTFIREGKGRHGGLDGRLSVFAAV